MVIKVQAEVYSILIILLALLFIVYYLGKAIEKSDPAEKPTGAANIGIMIVSMLDNLTSENMGVKFTKMFGPYVGTMASFILVSNIIGLLGLPTPTSNLSVTFCWGLISWLIIQGVAIKETHLSGYLKGLTEPIFLLTPVNLFGKIAPLLSMSLRLFGNILVGGVMMGLVYSFTAYLSSLVPVIGGFNFIGPLIAPALHAYFDLFAGAIQMFIFISLTTTLAGNEAAE